MAGTLRLTVVTPAGIAWEREAASVVLQTADGQIEVLPGHAAVVTLLAPGELWIKQPNADELFAAGEGFAEIGSEHVYVFTDLAENADAIALEATETARQRALEAVADSARLSDDERAAAILSLQECEVKMKIAARGKRPRHSPGAA